VYIIQPSMVERSKEHVIPYINIGRILRAKHDKTCILLRSKAFQGPEPIAYNIDSCQNRRRTRVAKRGFILFVLFQFKFSTGEKRKQIFPQTTKKFTDRIAEPLFISRFFFVFCCCCCCRTMSSLF